MSKLFAPFVLFALMLFSSPLRAEDMSLYDVEIRVDITAENASAAREKAMSDANRQAVMTVAGRLTTPEGTKVLDHLNNNQILNFIKEVTVGEEKVSDVRYMAKLKITINADILKAYLSEKNAPFAMVEESKIIIIPLFREFRTDSPLLWEGNNPWREAWVNNPLTTGPIKISALGDEANQQITAAQALQMNGIILDQIAGNNQTRNIYIADATYDGIDGLDITLSSYANGSQSIIKVPGMRSPQLFTDGVQKVKEYLIGQAQQQTLAVNTAAQEITVLYSYANLRDWVNLQKAIKASAGVTDLTTDALGNGNAQFKIKFNGTFDRLQRALRDKRLNLTAYDGFYNLERY